MVERTNWRSAASFRLSTEDVRRYLEVGRQKEKPETLSGLICSGTAQCSTTPLFSRGALALIREKVPSLSRRPLLAEAEGAPALPLDQSTRSYIKGTDDLAEATFQWNREKNLLTAEKNGKRITVTLTPPDWMRIEVYNERFLLISDRLGQRFHPADFTAFKVLGDNAKSSNHVVAYVSGLSEWPGEFDVSYDVAGDSTSRELPRLIREIELNHLAGECVRAGAMNLPLGQTGSVKAAGPNRHGEYLISSGRSTLFYNPTTQQFRLGAEWFSNREEPRILEMEKMENGRVISLRVQVESRSADKTTPIRRGVYKITFIPNSRTYSRSYQAELVSEK